ncbi:MULTISPECIES: type 1 glutamine amidotransferase [unclassified Cyanobium]|uniref:type 1 glutamine amidotransferase n=1 Tax=unclassified Cyanobium TaxID=2627006 RepID=UPI0020CF6610|nr:MULTISPECIES: type 1 glutamine amidotransferase [unclassified Cyanobium]MCP9834281.1 type 1 glutamine amidotransferase [Cyanobium sp. La Preciosa 7G6]MCP9937083.1 type 1 glutamine amidotransferase [Cyanobium sp. Aljojuca 7A6]
MTHLVVLQHLEREGPGRFAEEARRRGWMVTVCRPDRGEALPRLGPDQALLVLGGPMGVADIGSPSFPWLAGEVALLRECLTCERPVIGLCLGAQLLAVAAGGQVVPLMAGEPPVRAYEVGWGPVAWTLPQKEEPVLAGLGDTMPVLHWHGDRIQLPAAATLLGSTPLCAEQMFRIDHHAHGLQFHVEVTQAALQAWLDEDGDYVRQALGPDGVEQVRAGQARWGEEGERQGRLLINNLLDRAWALLGGYPLL